MRIFDPRSLAFLEPAQALLRFDVKPLGPLNDSLIESTVGRDNLRYVFSGAIL